MSAPVPTADYRTVILNFERAMRSRSILAALSGLLITGIVAAAITARTQMIENHRASERIAVGQELGAVRARIEREITRRAALLDGLNAFVEAGLDRVPLAFEQFASARTREMAGIRTLALAPGAVVSRVHPLEGNEQALGHDLLADPARREDTLRALAARTPVVSDRVTLRQGGSAVVVRKAIRFGEGMEPWGLAVVVVDDRALAESAELSETAGRFRLSLWSGDVGASSALVFGDGSIASRNPVLMDVAVPGGTWRLAAIPRDGWSRAYGAAGPADLIVVIAAVLAFAQVLIALRVDRELREAAARARSDAAQARRTLESALDSISEGFALYDADDRLALFNRKYKEMYDRSAAAIRLGARFEDVLLEGLRNGQYPDAVGHEDEWLARRIALHRVSDNAQTELELSDGRWVLVSEHRTADGGVAGVRTDITRLKQIERELQESNRSLEKKVRERVGELNRMISNLVEQIKLREQAQARLEEQTRRNTLLAAVIESEESGVTIADATADDTPLIYCNAAFSRITGYDASEVIGTNCRFLAGPETDPQASRRLGKALADGQPVTLELLNYRKDGSTFWNRLSLFAVRSDDGRVTHFVGVQNDVTLQRREAEEREQLRARLSDQSKFEALGTLAGGVAHEINTPVQYIGDNLRFLEGGFADCVAGIDRLHTATLATAGAGAAAAAVGDLDLDFLRAEIPLALRQSLDGVERISQIVLAVKEFSHPGQTTPTSYDLNRMIETAVTLSRNQWKYVADVHLDLDATIAPVVGYQNEMSQVMLNMICNARDAIEDAKRDARGAIRIATRRRDDFIDITIRDEGIGMPPQTIDRIFELFFTTKQPGRGTGQGLSICHAVVNKRHGGKIDVTSQPGVGTTFVITLPQVVEVPA
jgi:PAS domain S-box-containing protein